MRSPEETIEYRLLAAILIVIIALLLQLKLSDIFGWRPDIFLASLITLSFFLGIFEFAPLVLFGILLINWQPPIGWDIFILGVLPLVPFLFRKIIFPLKGWPSAAFTVFLGIVVFYTVVDYRLLSGNLPILLTDAFVSALYGLLLFLIFDYFYKEAP